MILNSDEFKIEPIKLDIKNEWKKQVILYSLGFPEFNKWHDGGDIIYIYFIPRRDTVDIKKVDKLMDVTVAIGFRQESEHIYETLMAAKRRLYEY